MKKTIFLFALIAAVCAACFAAAETLPAYAYTGNDPVEAAVAAFTADLGKGYLTEDNSVTVPAPIILKTAETGEGQMTVYGNFWVFNYVQNGEVLECISGGETPGVLTLVADGEKWVPSSFEGVDSGNEYETDILMMMEVWLLPIFWEICLMVLPSLCSVKRNWSSARDHRLLAFGCSVWLSSFTFSGFMNSSTNTEGYRLSYMTMVFTLALVIAT